MSFPTRSVFLMPVLMAMLASMSSLGMAEASELGTDWTPRWPIPLNNDLYDIAVNGSSSLVAVGAQGS
ncbi:MAG: hypothetical protein JWO94_2760, partial [Verrucomicrobiaceae bacterium]|nr:hypothetical protein [Verrucomicrobiaceae bacterium]